MLDMVNNAEREAINPIRSARSKRSPPLSSPSLRPRHHGLRKLGVYRNGPLLTRQRPTGVFKREYQEQRIIGRGDNILATIEPGGVIIDGVDEAPTHSFYWSESG